jgi:cysteine desulfurase
MTHELWTSLNEKMFEYLRSVSLGDLVAQQREKSGSGCRAARRAPHAPHAPSGRGTGRSLTLARRHVRSRLFRPQRHDAARSARVLEGMLPYLAQQYGNASSRHEYGRAARRAIDEARQRVAFAAGAHPTEVVFTSGGSEANNLFIKGAAACLTPGVVAISAIEHPCVREPAKQLQRAGWRLREIAVDENCRVGRRLSGARWPKSRPWYRSCWPTTKPVPCRMLRAGDTGHGRTGLVPYRRGAGIRQACAGFSRAQRAGVHAMTLSAHKTGRAEGRRGPGGGQACRVAAPDRGRRARARAALGHRECRGYRRLRPCRRTCGASLDMRARQLAALRAELEAGLAEQGATLFAGAPSACPTRATSPSAGIDGETLVGKLDRAGFAVAAGAACSSANPEPSHVLLAMGVAPSLARGAVRVSLGPDNTEAQVREFLAALRSTILQLKGLASIASLTS